MWNLKKLTVLMVLAVALCGSGAATAFDAKQLANLKATNACQGCDLSEADFSTGFFSSEVDLSGAELLSANLSGANLRGADLSDPEGGSPYMLNAILYDVILCKTLMPWGEENIHCP